MLDPETKRKARELGVPGFLDAVELVGLDTSYSSLAFDDKMKVVIDYSYQEKLNTQVERLIRNAHFRFRPNLHHILLSHQQTAS